MPPGRGVLTTHRLFVLGRRAPFRRPVLWKLELERLTVLGVVEPSFPQAYRVQSQVIGSQFSAVAAAGHATEVNYDALFVVHANGAAVFVGGPALAEKVQRWIDEARVARMMAVSGRVVPPADSPPGDPAPASPGTDRL